MNSKKAKQLRQDMLEMGYDPKEVKYGYHQNPIYLPVGIGLFRKVKEGIPRTLEPCGRKLYKDMKHVLVRHT